MRGGSSSGRGSVEATIGLRGNADPTSTEGCLTARSRHGTCDRLNFDGDRVEFLVKKNNCKVSAGVRGRALGRAVAHSLRVGNPGAFFGALGFCRN